MKSQNFDRRNYSKIEILADLVLDFSFMVMKNHGRRIIRMKETN